MEEEKLKVDVSSLTTVKSKQEQDTSLVNVEGNIVSDVIIKNAKASDKVKDVIDLAATSKALEKKETVEKIVEEKTKELISDAEKKKIESEAEKIRQEAEKVRKEEEKQIAELNKIKNTLLGEIENLKAEDDKATAYFNANKSILRCVGIREKLSLKAMHFWMYPASFIYALFQIILFPFTLVGFAVEQLLGIVESVCGKVAKGGWKIVVAIVTGIVIVGLIVGIYYLVTHYAIQIFN
jgi:hypothetical protein